MLSELISCSNIQIRIWKGKPNSVDETPHNLARLVLTIDCSPKTRPTYLSWAIATISMLVKHSITSTHIVQYYHQNAAAICCAALKKKVSHSRQIGLVKNQMFLELSSKSSCFYSKTKTISGPGQRVVSSHHLVMHASFRLEWVKWSEINFLSITIIWELPDLARIDGRE